MRMFTGWRGVLALGVLLGSAALAGPAPAAEDPTIDPLTAAKVAFDAADTDHDGIINEAELARDAAHGFAELDRDGDGFLTEAELGPHDPALFKRLDTNGDGKLSFMEIMTNKARALKEFDKDGDGGLDFDEMIESIRAEQGDMP